MVRSKSGELDKVTELKSLNHSRESVHLDGLFTLACIIGFILFHYRELLHSDEQITKRFTNSSVCTVSVKKIF